MIRGKRHKWSGYYYYSYSRSGSRNYSYSYSGPGSWARAGSKLGENND